MVFFFNILSILYKNSSARLMWYNLFDKTLRNIYLHINLMLMSVSANIFYSDVLFIFILRLFSQSFRDYNEHSNSKYIRNITVADSKCARFRNICSTIFLFKNFFLIRKIPSANSRRVTTIFTVVGKFSLLFSHETVS